MPKALSINEMRTRAARFVLDWKDAPGDERQEGQSFVRDLLKVYGITKTKAAAYEKRARRSSTANQGYIDALIPGKALIEMKSAGKDLDKAEEQALDYIDDLSTAEEPRYIITSDFKRFQLLDLHADGDDGTSTFALTDLPKEVEQFGFLAGYGVRNFSESEQEAASVEAAQIMARLYESLEGSGYDDHSASIFLVRTLFVLFADDAGVWSNGSNLFLEFLETRTSADGSDLGAQLTFLYQVMATPTNRRQTTLDELMNAFDYVNGSVFDEPLPIPSFSAAMRAQLLEACQFNWSTISPAVFGSLFQAVKSRDARRELGEHYTTETNIKKVIEPMFLDDLRSRFETNRSSAEGLRKLRKDMGAMRFLDPACGCGNFLVVAYREMRALELDILVRLQELQSIGEGGRRSATTFEPALMFDDEDLAVKRENFIGIEIEEWPARIAATALHLVDHQANQAMELALGMGPDTLPLDKIRTVYHANAIDLNWTDIIEPTQNLFVVGNPPFVGYDQRTESQREELQRVWRTTRIGRLDYVTAWHAKCVDFFNRSEYGGEFAFVSTNSITHGEPAPLLFGPLFSAGWRIKFAHRTFHWTSEAPQEAQVHCVIVGFEKDSARPRPARLFSYASGRGVATERVVPNINAYLVDAENVLAEKRSTPISAVMPTVRNGSVAGDTHKKLPNLGGLVMSSEEKQTIESTDPVAAKYLRPFVGGQDFLNGAVRWCLWLQDWDPADLQRSPELRRRLANVKHAREQSTEASTRALAATPYRFKHIAQPTDAYICIPRTVSINRPYLAVGYLSPDVIVSNGSFWAADPDGLIFSVASSGMFMAWQRAVGGRFKSDPRFSNTIVWNNFPMPDLSDAQRAAVIRAGRDVLYARSLFPERSLATHYNPLAMAEELLKAHRALDSAMDRAFGLRGAVDDDERTKALFAAYAQLRSSEELPVRNVRKRGARAR